VKAPIDEGLLLGRSIDNSRVVREVDPRSSRDLWGVLLLVLALAAGLGFYAWPHFEARRAGRATGQLQRERERLIEENRKLRLEKASLEELRRVELIAVKQLGLELPPPERVVVIERPTALPEGARLASRRDGAGPAAN